MELCISKQQVIIDLHKRGFTEDFKIIQDSLFWVQGKKFLLTTDFLIAESYHFVDRSGADLFIFGITANCFSTNGILINHSKDYSDKILAIIGRKLQILNSHLSSYNYNYVDVIFSRP